MLSNTAKRYPFIPVLMAGVWLASCGTEGDPAVVYDAPFSIPVFETARITGVSGLLNSRQIETAVHFPEGTYERATLLVELESPCFPFEKWFDSPPPTGHNWPADCDPFDRNFEITLDQPYDPSGPAAIELMRAVTPFGGPLHLEVDITNVMNGAPGDHSLEVFISTGADPSGQATGMNAGWDVSVHIDAVPGPAPRNVLAVIPIIKSRLNHGDTPAEAIFDVPAGTVSSRLEYRVTGHGGGDPSLGCIGPSEEFCQRAHTVFADGAQIAREIPWRDDCYQLCNTEQFQNFTYCRENPTGALSSVRAPRANWCPGSVTDPFVWSPPALAQPGAHSFNYQVEGHSDGGNWRVSATLFAFGD